MIKIIPLDTLNHLMDAHIKTDSQENGNIKKNRG